MTRAASAAAAARTRRSQASAASARAAAEAAGRAAVALDRLRRVVHLFPLALARAWDNPAPRTSQLRALRACLDPRNREGAVFGGNRTGKTELFAIVAALFLLGPKHPAAIAFLAAAGIPLDWIPYRPEGLRICCLSLTFSESVRVQRPKVDRWLGPGARWKNRDARKEAEVRVSGDGGGWAIFKANDQGARRMQADAFDLVWVDEEPDRDVYNELIMRTIDRRGRMLLSMTPLRGKTHIHDRFVAPDKLRAAQASGGDLIIPGPKAGTVACWIHGKDNPHIPQDFLEAALSSYGEHERAARERGEFVALEGRVFTMFDRSVHECDPFPIPPEWRRFQGWDFGASHPTSVHDYVLDPATDRLYVVWERYAANETIEAHANAVKVRETCSACDGRGFDLDLTIRDRLTGLPALEWDRTVQSFDGDALDAAPILAEKWGTPCPACEGHAGRSAPRPEWRVADPAGKSERLSLAAAGLRTVAAEKGPSSIRAGISAVSARLAPGQDGVPRLLIFRGAAPFLCSELEGYIWDTREGQKTDGPDLPVDKDNHAIDELRYTVTKIDRARTRGAGGFATVGGDERTAADKRLDRDRASRSEDPPARGGAETTPGDPWARNRRR
jgi:phage terminase large subunit-like protein